MFKLIFPSKNLYVFLLAVTSVADCGWENKRAGKKQRELYDGLTSKHTLFCEVLNIFPPLYLSAPDL